VDCYYPASTIENAFQTLSRCLDRAEGTGLVVGGAGTGKSLLCRLLAHRFRDRFHVAALDSASLCSRRALLQSILFELGLPYRGMEEGELRLSLIDFLTPDESSDEPSRGGMLLLIDEAHTLPLKLIEEIRMITNLVRNGEPRVRLLLAGNPTMEERLASPKLESLNQRIAARCYLQPFTYDETSDYIRAQLSAAGGDASRLFVDDAWQAVYNTSGGIPRLVNQICDHALMLTAVAQRDQLDATVIEEAWADLQQLPMPPRTKKRAADSTEGVVEFGELESPSAPVDDAETAVVDPAEEPLPTVDVSQQLDEIELRFSELDKNTSSALQQEASEIIPDEPPDQQPPDEDLEVSAANDPFAESFEEEEPVHDHYTSLQASALEQDAGSRPEDREFSAAVETIFENVQVTLPPSEAELVGLRPSEAQEACEPAPTEQLEPETSAEEHDSEPSNDEPEPDSPTEAWAHELPAEPPDFDLPAEPFAFEPLAEEFPTALTADQEASEPSIVRLEDPPDDEETGAEATDEAETVPARVVRGLPPDDSDLIVVEDEMDGSRLNETPGKAYREEYRHLFTKLRES
jgi:type II secretory pathway predicted ATPase ExeA